MAEYDPCLEAASLRLELTRLVSGSRATVVEVEGGSSGVRRRVHMQEVSITQLRQMLREAEEACIRSKNGPPSRFAAY